MKPFHFLSGVSLLLCVGKIISKELAFMMLLQIQSLVYYSYILRFSSCPFVMSWQLLDPFFPPPTREPPWFCTQALYWKTGFNRLVAALIPHYPDTRDFTGTANESSWNNEWHAIKCSFEVSWLKVYVPKHTKK